MLWVKYYLDQLQYTCYNSLMPDGLNVLTSILQGSKFDPTLLIFYVNGIFERIKGVDMRLLKLTVYYIVMVQTGFKYNEDLNQA